MVRLTRWEKALERYLSQKDRGEQVRKAVWEDLQHLRQALEAHHEQ